MEFKVKNRVAALRQERKISQMTLAKKLETNREYLSAIENNRAGLTLEKAFIVKSFLNVTLDEIFFAELVSNTEPNKEKADTERNIKHATN